MPTLLSIQVGMPCERGDDRPWRTGYFKDIVPGPVHVAIENLAGDGQAAIGAHGGADRAVLAYGAGHYPDWRAEFPSYAFPYGAFGENITVSELDEDTVCIGDRHQIGEVVLEVSMPRSPCGNISRATGVDTLFERVKVTGKFGWLYRVIQEGQIEAGEPVVITAGPNPSWTIARTYEVYCRTKANDPTVAADAQELAAVEALAVGWRERLAKGPQPKPEATSI